MNRKLLLVIILGCIGAGLWSSQYLTYQFQTDPLAFGTSEQVQQYLEYKKNFGSDRETIAIGLSRKDSFNTLEDFREVERLTTSIRSIEGISELNSIESIPYPFYNGLISNSRAFLSLENDASFRTDFEQLSLYNDITEKFLSEDRTALAFYVFVHDSIQDQSQVIQHLYSRLEASSFNNSYYVGGAPAFKEEGERVLARETLWISVLGCLLILGCMLLLVPNFYRIALTLLFTVFNISMTLLFMYVMQIEVTSLSSAVPSIIAILSFTDITHILYHYNRLQESGTSQSEIRKSLFKKIGLPLILTSASNLLGFVIFFFNGGVEIITELALASSFGIVFAYSSSRFVLPYFLNYKEKGILKTRQILLENAISSSVHYMRGRYKSIAPMFLILFVLLLVCVGCFQCIDMYYYDKQDLDLGVNRSSAFYDTKFQGIRDIEVVLETTESDVLNLETLQKIEQIETYLLEEYGCRSVFSIATAIKRYQRFSNGGNPSMFQLPTNLNARYKNALFEQSQELSLATILSEDLKTTRIIGSLPDIGTNEAKSRNRELFHYIAQYDTGTTTTYINGKAYIFDYNVLVLSSFVLWALLIGLVVVAIVVGILFRSVAMGLITFIANAFPLLFGMLMMHLLDVPLHPGSIFILTILLGIALDDSIYILGHYYRASKEQGANTDIFIKSLKTNSLPLLVTSLVLGTSFLALTISSYSFTVAFGIVVSSSLIFAFVVDLFFMPSLILTVLKRKHS